MMQATETKIHELTVTKIFNAPQEKVFAAWTDPQHLNKWWGKADFTTKLVEVDFRVGGRYRLGMGPANEDTVHICTGEFREIKKPEKVVYTWSWEQGGSTTPDTLVTVEFRDKGDQTELVLHHSGFDTAETCASHNEGWNDVIKSFEQYLAKSDH
jgi:uncharacterized protein YndB with AHSA1/START domain